MVDGSFGSDFSKDHDHASFDASLTGNFGVGIDAEMCIQNRIGYLMQSERESGGGWEMQEIMMQIYI